MPKEIMYLAPISWISPIAHRAFCAQITFHICWTFASPWVRIANMSGGQTRIASCKIRTRINKCTYELKHYTNFVRAYVGIHFHRIRSSYLNNDHISWFLQLQVCTNIVPSQSRNDCLRIQPDHNRTEHILFHIECSKIQAEKQLTCQQ